jgi:hypothetical protein
VKAEPYLTLAKKGASQAELTSAKGNLRFPIMEMPQFWSSMANDPEYPALQRRAAVDELFQRHVNPYISLTEMMSLLDHPTWITAENIKVINGIQAKGRVQESVNTFVMDPVVDQDGTVVPVRINSDNTVFALNVLPMKNEGQIVIYLEVYGKIDEQSFKDLLTGKGPTTIGNATIAAVSWREDNSPGFGIGGKSGASIKPPAATAPAAKDVPASASAPTAKPAPSASPMFLQRF